MLIVRIPTFVDLTELEDENGEEDCNNSEPPPTKKRRRSSDCSNATTVGAGSDELHENHRLADDAEGATALLMIGHSKD